MMDYATAMDQGSEIGKATAKGLASYFERIAIAQEQQAEALMRAAKALEAQAEMLETLSSAFADVDETDGSNQVYHLRVASILHNIMGAVNALGLR